VEVSRDLRLLAGAVGLSAFGDVLALITLALLVHDLTGSGLAVSALFATTMVPAVALAPLAGLLADRVESVHVLALASLAQCVVAVGLAFATDLTLLLALATLLAAGAAVSQPAEFALVPAVAGSEERLTRANGVVESARYLGFTAGPIVGAGVLAAGGGTRPALLVNAASFLAIAGAALSMRTRRPPVRAGRGGRERAFEGVAYLWRDGVVRTVVGAGVAALLFVSASFTVEVFYAKDVLRVGDAGYALLMAAWTVGMVTGATGVAQRVPGRWVAAGSLVALAVQGGGMAAQTAWAVLPVALLGYLVGGVGHGVKNTLIRTVIQRRVPDRLHGRAFAAYNAARNSAELGALGAGGLLVSAIGARPALLLAGLGPVIAGLTGLAVLRTRVEHSGGRTAAVARGESAWSDGRRASAPCVGKA
jgi:MFS family permease